jgi:hypothetical protein
MKTTPNNIISTHLESEEKGLQLLYRGKIDQKRKVHTLKQILTLRLQRIIDRLQKSNIDHNVHQYTSKDYNKPQKSDIDYKRHKS